MTNQADINPRFSHRETGELSAPKPQILNLHSRPMQLLALAESEQVLSQVVEAIAILQVGDRLFSGSNPTWRSHHRRGLRSDLMAYVDVMRDARAGWKSDWIKNNGLSPELYREAEKIEAQIRKAYNLNVASPSLEPGSLDQLFCMPFQEYHFKFVTFEATNSGGSRAVYHSTRVDHGDQDVRFIPSARSIFSGSALSEAPPKFICGAPRKMEHPPKNDAEYFELHFCTAVDEHGTVRQAPETKRGLAALAALRVVE